MPQPLRIAIVTTGRFYVLDLARELHALGHDVRFYSYVPLHRAERFGLPRQCHRSLLAYVLPLIVLQRFFPRWSRGWVHALILRVVDQVAAWRLEPCDVFIGMSGICVKSARLARERFGAKVVLDRGSRHILSQKEILEAIPSVQSPAAPDFDVKRELWGYDYADAIAVPSHHAEISFLERGIPSSKLLRNPYGVDLTMFPPTLVPDDECQTAVFVGSWCYRKGCDILWDVCRRDGSWRLLHVGLSGDLPLPRSELFTHIDPVPQWKLADIYRRANIAILASREDGFGLVLSQALACGLPVVCTDRTGGADLQGLLPEPRWVTVVPSGNPEALLAGIHQAFGMAMRQSSPREILGPARASVSWQAYGKRYETELRKLCQPRRRPNPHRVGP